MLPNVKTAVYIWSVAIKEPLLWRSGKQIYPETSEATVSLNPATAKICSVKF